MLEYDAILAFLEKACFDYRMQKLRLDDLKKILWQASERMTFVEKARFRDFLMKTEGQLDILQFTVDEDAIFEETLVIINEIEDMIAQEKR